MVQDGLSASSFHTRYFKFIYLVPSSGQVHEVLAQSLVSRIKCLIVDMSC